MTLDQPLEAPSTHAHEDVLNHYQVERNNGLNEGEIRERREQFGENRLRESEQRSALSILIDQFKSVVVVLLAIASGVSFVFGNLIEAVAILAVIVVNTAIGFFTELRAVRSMEALRELGQVTARVRREGTVREIDAKEIVPGDILLLEGGDIVTADARLLEAAKLQANESALTGESVPVSKDVQPVEGETELAERKNMVFKGTSITRGSGEAIVVSIGMDTELGQISSMVEEAEDETTPLEKRLDQLGHRLIWLSFSVTVLVVIAGLISGKELSVLIETTIALAVAAVPEGLPIVATIALARGMRRMAHQNALINRLSTVETLGATNIICTDKTGTLTENEMTLSVLQFNGAQIEVDEAAESGDEPSPLLMKALRIGVLCNNASLNRDDEGEPVGEPLEVALVQAGARFDLYHNELTGDLPEAREVAFDTDTKMMATFHEQDGGYYVAVKGAPEAVLDVCTRQVAGDNAADGAGETRDLSDEEREEWIQKNTELAGRGLRMLAVAEREAGSSDEDPYHDLTFVGLVGLLDPPRDDVADAIRDCQRAGMRVVMVTGDQSATARNIGQAVGLVDADTPEVVRGKELRPPEELSDEERQRMLDTAIFARVNPEQKLHIIALHQEAGRRVAMTGDGVNDAPALKKADIGIAMGQRGTQVAQETADMVLKDDALSTIVVAVRQGRIIFENIRKSVMFMLSTNMSQIVIVGLAALVNAPLPITALQILFLNTLTDVFPALALGVGEGDETVMDDPPRDPEEPILRRDHWLRVALYSVVIAASVLTVFAIALVGLGFVTERAVTVSFLTLAFAKLWHVFNLRSPDTGPIRNDITRNPWIWASLVLCAVLLLLATYLPFLQTVLRTVDPGLTGWALVLGGSLAPLVIIQIGMFIVSQFRSEES